MKKYYFLLFFIISAFACQQSTSSDSATETEKKADEEAIIVLGLEPFEKKYEAAIIDGKPGAMTGFSKDSFYMWTYFEFGGIFEKLRITKITDNGYYKYSFWRKGYNHTIERYLNFDIPVTDLIKDSLGDINNDGYADLLVKEKTKVGMCVGNYWNLFCLDPYEKIFRMVEGLETIPNIRYEPATKMFYGYQECKGIKEKYQLKWKENFLLFDTIVKPGWR